MTINENIKKDSVNVFLTLPARGPSLHADVRILRLKTENYNGRRPLT